MASGEMTDYINPQFYKYAFDRLTTVYKNHPDGLPPPLREFVLEMVRREAKALKIPICLTRVLNNGEG